MTGKTTTAESRTFGDGYITYSGLRLDSVLSATLFKEIAQNSSKTPAVDIAAACYERWVDLAAALASLPTPLEWYAVIGSIPNISNDNSVAIVFVAVGRGRSKKSSSLACSNALQNLHKLLATILDYGSVLPITDKDDLQQVLCHLSRSHTVEFRRRYEYLKLSHGRISPPPVVRRLGFTDKVHGEPSYKTKESIGLRHLFPWVPSNEPWRRIMECLAAESKSTALVIHSKSLPKAPAKCMEDALTTLAAAENIVSRTVGLSPTETILALQAEALRLDALKRLTVLENPLLAARIFVTSNSTPADATLTTVLTSISDPSVHIDMPGASSLFKGGGTLIKVESSSVTEELSNPDIELLFGAAEATSFIRTPMPDEFNYPGLPINRARTAPLTGISGEDSAIGVNNYRSKRICVNLDGAMRFRHNYIIGQTGTGKSTLMVNMILHDIRAGRGVAVLDPHGTLVEDVLRHIPLEREDDVVLVDITDIAYPIGFNILKIPEVSHVNYRRSRDVLVDDIYLFLDMIYDLQKTGGPMFETYFRGMLSLLMSDRQNPEGFPPNLMLFRALFVNSAFRKRLTSQIDDTDFLLKDFIHEIEEAKYDMSLGNVAPYVTSKFNRFITDSFLRNIICQNQMLDIDDIVNSGKILLFNTGKGRFGELAAGLLASQVVTRIRYAVMRRGKSGIRQPFYLYADEFQNFADLRFAELLAEARKFGLSLTIANQFARQLPEPVLFSILGNVGTVINLRVGAEDAELLEPLFAPTFRATDLSSLSNFTACVRSFGILGQTPFSVELNPPPENGSTKVAKRVRQTSRKRYGRPRRTVEKEIAETYRAFMKEKDGQ
jgi:hypothetical protein